MAISEDRKRLFTTVVDGEKVGISLWEIMACLGYYRRDKNGRRNLGMIIKNGDVNIWAKYKPFVKVNQSTRFEVATYDERKLANFGLLIPYSTSITTLKDKYYNAENNNEGMNGWDRQIPRGTAYNEPFRVRDFDGYNHKAVCPFQSFTPPTAGLNQWETSGFTVALRKSEGGEESDSIKFTDIDEIANCYFTIQMRHRNPVGNGVYIRTISAETPFRESMGGSEINFSTYQLPKGDWDVIPFLSPVPFGKEQDGNEIPGSSRYYPIPKSLVSTMKISEVAYIAESINAYKLPVLGDSQNYRVAYNFKIRNNSSNSHEFNNIIVQIRYPEAANDSAPNYISGEQQVVYSNITVPSGQSIRLTDALANGGLAFNWESATIGSALYNNATGVELRIKLGNGEPWFKVLLKVSSTTTPEYTPDTDPTVPEI